MKYLQNLILRLPFIQAALTEATFEGSKDAFAKAHADIRETMADDLNKKAEELASVKLQSLLSIVDDRLIISVNKPGQILIGGVAAEDNELANLKSEAEFLRDSHIWKLIQETPKRLAEKAMFIEGDSIDAMKKGRSMLYLLSTQRNIVDILLNFRKK